MSPKSLFFISCTLLWSCSDQSPAITTLDEAGEQFVRLGLELGEYDGYYVDSYVGPEEWREHAKEHLQSKQALVQAIEGNVVISRSDDARNPLKLPEIRPGLFELSDLGSLGEIARQNDHVGLDLARQLQKAGSDAGPMGLAKVQVRPV